MGLGVVFGSMQGDCFVTSSLANDTIGVIRWEKSPGTWMGRDGVSEGIRRTNRENSVYNSSGGI